MSEFEKYKDDLGFKMDRVEEDPVSLLRTEALAKELYYAVRELQAEVKRLKSNIDRVDASTAPPDGRYSH